MKPDLADRIEALELLALAHIMASRSFAPGLPAATATQADYLAAELRCDQTHAPAKQLQALADTIRAGLVLPVND